MTASSDFTIELLDLSKSFGPIQAVDRLRFEVRRGEIFGLVGPDGAGKTTTLRMLAGILDPDDGTARIAGFDIVEDADALKSRISYMPQRFGLYEDLSVDENMDFYADLFGVRRKERRERTDRLLAFSGLAPFRTRLAGKLSGGMKQKLGLACALIHTPEVLLLDEPTNGVDPVSRRDFWRILYSLLESGVTILITTAYLDEAERANRVGLMHQGRLLVCDRPAAIKSRLKATVVEVTCSDPRRAHTLLTDTYGPTGAVLVGGRLHVVVDDPARHMPIIRQQLESSGITIEAERAVAPTLEDVFVSVIEEMRAEA